MSGKNKEAKEMVAAVRARGFHVEMGGSHYLVKDPETQGVLSSIAVSPSDRRFWQNTVRDLKSVGVLTVDPKKEGSMTAPTRPENIRAETVALSRRLRDTLVELGWKDEPGTRSHHLGDFVRLAISTAKQKRLRPFKSADSGYNTLYRLLRGEGNVSRWAQELIETTLDELTATPKVTTTPEPTTQTMRSEIVRTKLRDWMNNNRVSVETLAALMQRFGAENGLRHWFSEPTARTSLTHLIAGDWDYDPWVYDLVDRFVDEYGQPANPETSDYGRTETEPTMDEALTARATAKASTNGVPLALRVTAAAVIQIGPEAAVELGWEVMQLEGAAFAHRR